MRVRDNVAAGFSPNLAALERRGRGHEESVRGSEISLQNGDNAAMAATKGPLRKTSDCR